MCVYIYIYMYIYICIYIYTYIYLYFYSTPYMQWKTQSNILSFNHSDTLLQQNITHTLQHPTHLIAAPYVIDQNSQCDLVIMAVVRGTGGAFFVHIWP